MAEAENISNTDFRLSCKNIWIYADLEKAFLGNGQFGTVYRCFTNEHRNATIKLYELRGCKQDFETIEQDALKEAHTLKEVNFSEHVIDVYGYTKSLWHIGIVTEYMPRGNLNYLMQQNGIFIPLSLRVRILCETATGLDHMHRFRFDKRITHNDLKPGNILLDENFHAKICDFGGANIAAHTSHTSATLKIPDANQNNQYTLEYSAPELLTGVHNIKKKSPHKFRRTKHMDIYSFGMVTYFVLTSEHPFRHMSDFQKREAIIKGTIPTLEVQNLLNHFREEPDNSEVIKSMIVMVKQCWQKDPAKRPNAEVLKSELRELLQFFTTVDQDVINLQKDFPIEKDSESNLISLDTFLHPFKRHVVEEHRPASQRVHEEPIAKADASTVVTVVEAKNNASNLLKGEVFQLKTPSRIVECRVEKIFEMSFN